MPDDLTGPLNEGDAVPAVVYYESHVTIEPVFGERLEAFKASARVYDFRVADLVMQKGPDQAPEPSKKDSFCTARGNTYTELHDRMQRFVSVLVSNGFGVRRYKIEAVVFDERCV